MVDKESLTEILDGLKTDLNFEDYEHDVMKPVKVTTGLWIKKCKAAVGAFNFWYKLRDDQLKIAEEHFFGLNAPVRILDEIMDGPTKYWSVMSSHGSGGINLSIASSQIAIFQIFNKLAKSNDENSQEILKHCIECLEVVNKGQAIEILWRENFQCPSIADYFNMTKMKVNAAFFMLDDIMTILSGNKTDYKEIIALFGIYFQIHNDYYNLFAPDHKNRHQDFADDLTEGKFSYPLIYAIKNLKNEEVAEILKQKPSDDETKKRRVDILKEIGCQEHCMKVLKDMAETIKEKLVGEFQNPILSFLLDASFNFDNFWI